MRRSALKRRRERRCRLNKGFALVVDRMDTGRIKSGEKHVAPLSWEDTLHDSGREDLQAFRQLRDSLLLRSEGGGLRTLAVCKANAGEGSSRVACHLAMAFASDPRVRVALVDSDFHHPELHAYLRVQQANGLYGHAARRCRYGQRAHEGNGPAQPRGGD